MAGKKRKTWIILTAVAVCILGVLFYIWYARNHTGSRSGRVIDAVTGEPIEGAVVAYEWVYTSFFGITGEMVAARYATTTDKEGRYHVPNQRTRKRRTFLISLKPESVLIYKDSYSVYTLRSNYSKPREASNFGERQVYREKDNLVKLSPWQQGWSHRKHLEYIEYADAYYDSLKLLQKELKPERQRADEEPYNFNDK